MAAEAECIELRVDIVYLNFVSCSDKATDKT